MKTWLSLGKALGRELEKKVPRPPLTAVVGSPPLNAHVELVTHSHIYSECHTGLLHILGVPDPQLTERLWGDLDKCIRQCCPFWCPTSQGPALSRSAQKTTVSLQVAAALPSPASLPMTHSTGTYKAVAGAESAVGHHAKAGRTVRCGTTVWAEAGLTLWGQGAGHLPAVQKGSRVLCLTHHRAVLQGEVIGCISVTDTWKGHNGPNRHREHCLPSWLSLSNLQMVLKGVIATCHVTGEESEAQGAREGAHQNV